LLENDAAPFETAIRRDPSGPAVSASEDQLVALVAPSGLVRLSTLPNGLRNRVRSLETSSKGPHTVATSTASYLVLTETVSTAAGEWKIISARNEDASALLLDPLSQALIIGAVILVLGFGVASWVLTAAALRPVNRMREDAERFGASDSPEALPIGPARDELAALATTLNAFIASNRHAVEREKQMVSDASHELRTPIAVLIAQLELADSSTGDAVFLHQEIAAVRRTADRLATLATNLLELSKLEAEQHPASSEWGQLVMELSSSIDRARTLAQSRNITVDFDVTGTEEARRYPLSGASFSRLVDNLVMNAITASPERGSIRIDLAQAKGELRLVVVDEGTGMPEDFIPLAFDRFTRPDGARRHELGGSGLGLAIVHAIVSAANGTIRIENRVPGGLMVVVTMPRTADR
ncbi:MAG: sensor histidine kinase, partial [Lacisediminihabitans sp.]